MELSTTRETRGKSVELDGRRINAVSPMHLGESVLQNLLKEHQQQQTSSGNHAQPPVDPLKPPIKDDSDRKLQQMLEKYQSQVKLQQQRAPSQPQMKTTSRNNLHKIEKMASNAARSSSNSVAVSSTGHSMSHSQPCLIAISDRPPEYSAPQPLSSNPYAYQRRSSGSGSGEQYEVLGNGLANQRVPNNQKLIQSLREENLFLKREIETLKKKLTKLQLIETSYDRIVHDYEVIMRDKERQETIESNALVQMEMHLKRVVSEKELLQSRIDQLQMSSVSSIQASAAMEKINQLNNVLAELIPQNKDLQTYNERQKMEMNAQSATLEEQRNHIAMLEKALGNAQDRLTKRDKTCEELSLAAERANMLQRQLHDTLVDKQARDEAHATERAQWEMDITQLKMQLNKDASLTGSLKRSSLARNSADNGDEAMLRLKKTVHSRDERITQLERTVVELQRKLHEESERKKLALGALSDNLESKIRRLENEKSDKDRRIAELTEEKEKLGDILGEGRDRSVSEAAYYTRDRTEADTSRDLHKMEEMRQRIQERKRKGRVGPTGGLMGVASDHSRSSSGSLLAAAGHRRTSSGPFDPCSFDPSMMSLSGYGGGGGSRPDSNGNGYTTTVSFKGTKRETSNGEAEWNV